MKLLTWNACRLLARGRELALVNILTSSGADITTIAECEIPEGSGEFSVAGYTTFSPAPSLQGGKTQVLILVKNDLAVRANVKVVADIMDPAVRGRRRPAGGQQRHHLKSPRPPTPLPLQVRKREEDV
jgi:hypothetical protein